MGLFSVCGGPRFVFGGPGLVRRGAAPAHRLATWRRTERVGSWALLKTRAGLGERSRQTRDSAEKGLRCWLRSLVRGASEHLDISRG